MSLMTPERVQQLVDRMAEWWEIYAVRWETMDEIVLFHEVQEILARAVCEWAGVPLDEAEFPQRVHDLTAMVDGAAAVGPRHWRGQRARSRAEAWIGELVEQVRNGTIDAGERTALHAVARHQERDGERLTERVAAVELLSVLRPTVAVARYVVFIALALHDNPAWRSRLQRDGEDELERFVHEVRRYYPFFPFVGARVRETFEWNGYTFPEGQRVLLDLYGTNRDPQLWDDPEAFRPDRFRGWDGDAFGLIPQGGGDHYHNHRCAGEWITIALMKRAARLLARAIAYEVPDQDLRINLSRIPAIPKSRFLMRGVRRTT